VRAVGRRGADDPGLAPQEPVNLGHGVADAVEEDDIAGRDAGTAALVDLLGQELAGLGHPGRVAVGPGAVVVDDLVVISTPRSRNRCATWTISRMA